MMLEGDSGRGCLAARQRRLFVTCVGGLIVVCSGSRTLGGIARVLNVITRCDRGVREGFCF